ncbi:MAG TPA: nucleotide sugar dehydrogenase [Actinomycetota bacterium]|nr:nucleotide sugar dehydrogenase [Actinomycetota bacterium]
MELTERIHEADARVAIIGLGYVGLPLALAAADAGFEVLGFDTSADRVAALRDGTSPVTDVSDDELRAAVERGAFRPTALPEDLQGSDVFVICVPTPLRDELPDMSYIESAGNLIAEQMKPGALVVLESTTYPGTTEEFLRPILEKGGLIAGGDFHLGFSPERIDPGNPEYGLKNVPKIVGGVDETSTALMEAFYGKLVDRVVTVSSPMTAEMAKLLENTYRHINIALANEMAIVCHDLGISIWEVIDAASTKPFGFHPFYPGPGWGGHCIPVDPAYLSWRVRQMGGTAHFVELAREINARMPAYVVQRITDALNDEGKSLKASRILLLGVAYKPDVGDVRESPALEILARLRKAGANVSFHDPYVEEVRVAGEVIPVRTLDSAALRESDIVVAITNHSTYDWQDISDRSRLVLDTRNALAGITGGNVVTL